MARFEDAIRFANRIAIRTGKRQRVIGVRGPCYCRRREDKATVHDGYVGWEYVVRREVAPDNFVGVA